MHCCTRLQWCYGYPSKRTNCCWHRRRNILNIHILTVVVLDLLVFLYNLFTVQNTVFDQWNRNHSRKSRMLPTSDDTSNGKQEWLTKYVVYLFGLFTDRFCCVPETRQSNGQYVRLTSWHGHHWMGADLFRLSRRVTLDTLRFWMHYDTREIETNMRLMHSSSCHTAWRKDKKKKNENVMLCDANREWDHAQKRRWIAMCNVVAVSVGWWKVIYVCVYMHRSSNPDTGYNMAYTTCMFVFGFGVSACYNYDTLSNRSTERIGLWTIGFTISLNARTMFTILFCIFFTFKLMKFCMYVQLSHTPHTTHRYSMVYWAEMSPSIIFTIWKEVQVVKFEWAMSQFY